MADRAISDDRTVLTATIAASASDSGAVVLGGRSLVGVIPPSTGSGDFTASTAYLLFKVSVDGTSYDLLRDEDGLPVYVTVAANNTYGRMPLSPSDFVAWRFVKVCTYQDKVAAPTEQAQSASRTIKLVAAKVSAG